MTIEPRTTNHKSPLVLPSVQTISTYCAASPLRNTVCSSFRPPAPLHLKYSVHQLKLAASGIHRPPLGLSAFLPPSSLALHPWPITHHSSTPTFNPSPPIIKLAAALCFKTYYTHHIFISLFPGQADSPSAQKESIMQNKPNFPNTQINVNSVLSKDYENVSLPSRRQNKPNQTQFPALFFLPILPIHPNQTQFQPTPAQQLHNFALFCTVFYCRYSLYLQGLTQFYGLFRPISLPNLFSRSKICAGFNLFITYYFAGKQFRLYCG